MIASALALAPGLASANELIKVYELAVTNDPAYTAAQHARDAGIAARPLARAALLPQLAGPYAISDQTDDITSQGQTFHSQGEPYTLAVSLSQTLFDWPAFQSFSQAGDAVLLAEVVFRGAQQSLLLRSAEAYFNLLAAADNLRSARAENKAIERQLEQARRRFEVGLSAITDVQEAQARFDLTVAQAIEAEQAFRSSREAVAEITGATGVSLSTVQEQITLPGPDPLNVETWTGVAVSENLELKAALLQEEIAHKSVRIAQGGYWPSVNLTATKAEGESTGFNTGEFEQEKITLNVSVPLFSGLGTVSAVGQAQSTRDQRKAEALGTRRRVERNTRDAYQGVLAGASRVKAFKQAVLSNTTAQEASEVGLQVGARTAVDVLNAQQQLYSAQRNYSRARYDYLLSILRLKAAAGRLSETDLAEIDRLLITCPASAGTAEDAADNLCAVDKAG
jgi:outer membrane protein